jgi:DNA-binding transcriptional ArsR family regulator
MRGSERGNDRGSERGDWTGAGVDISVPAALLGHEIRASIVMALMGADELSAGDLATRSKVSYSTISRHLARLSEGRLVAVAERGRHRFFRLAGPRVRDAVAALASIAPAANASRISTGKAAAHAARTCYDHLAGRLGVSLTDELLRRRLISERGGGYSLTRGGAGYFRDLGLNLPELRARRRAYAVRCMDGTERRPHLGGALGAGLAAHMFELGWLRRVQGNRSVLVTHAGRMALRERFGIEA